MGGEALVATGIQCWGCQGLGAVSVPETTEATAFGTVHRDSKVVTCPICSGRGTA